MLQLELCSQRNQRLLLSVRTVAHEELTAHLFVRLQFVVYDLT